MRAALAHAAVLATLLITPAGAAACGTWKGTSPGIGGASGYDRGEFIHQDYIYDDNGAAVAAPRAPVGDTDALPAGSFSYPGADDPRYLNNGADLRELRLRLEGDTLAIRVELNSMTAPGAAVAGIALDLHDDLTGPAMTWPHDAGLTTPGTDAVVSVWGTGADLTRRGGATAPLRGVCADVAANALEVRVPLSALGGGDRWRVYAATGVWDGAAWQSPAPTGPRAFDIGFVAGEGANSPDIPGGMNWFDVKQAKALAAGAIDGYYGTVDLDLLRSGVAKPYELRPGFYEVVYRASATLGPDNEGWRTAGRFQGPYQPYSLYVPTAYEHGRKLGLFAYFHGATRNHTQLTAGKNMQEQLGEGLGLAIVGALSRGGLGGTEQAANVLSEANQGPNFLDAREMLADVRARLPIDRSRQYVGGYSMGGIAAYQLLSLYPDEWAGAVLWAATKPNGSDEWLAGARWVPTLFVHAPSDEVVTYEFSLQSATALQGYGYAYELHSHPGEHEHQATTDDYHQPAAFFRSLRAPADPAHVTAVRVPGFDVPALGLRANSAYWVSELETKAAIARADLISLALDGSEPGVAAVGPTAVSGPPDPYVSTGQRYVWPGNPLGRANALAGTLTGVSALTVDARRAGLDPTAPATLRVSSDTASSLLLIHHCAAPVELPLATGESTLVVPVCAPPLGLPRTQHCASRRHFYIHPRAPHGHRLRSVRVYVRGRLVRVRHGRARIDLRGLPRGRVRVKIVVRTRDGRRFVQQRRYRTCGG